MDTMTDARAVEVLAAMREDGGVVADADYTAAIDRAVARLREPVGVQGGGEVVAERHALYGIRWIKQLRDMKPGTQWFIEGRAEPIATVTSSAGVLWHMAESEIPHGTKYRAAPPSAPVGVEGLVKRVTQLREAIESEPDNCFGVSVKAGRAYGVRDNLLCIVGMIEEALVQQPAVVDDARRVMHELCDCPNGRAEHAEWCAALAAQPGGAE